MEIDFNELETFEKQLDDKRQKNKVDSSTTSITTITTSSSSPPTTTNEQNVDELDAYLDRLVIDLKSKNDDPTSDKLNSANAEQGSNSTMSSQNLCDNKHTVADNTSNTSIVNPILNPMSFPMLLLGFLSILAFVNSVNCKKFSII